MSAMQTHPPPTFNTNILIHVKNLLRGNVKKHNIKYIERHCPNRREEGQPQFKKLKRKDFLTKVGEGGGRRTYCQKWKRSILYDLLLNLAQRRFSVFFCLYTPDPQKVIGIIENVSSKA